MGETFCIADRRAGRAGCVRASLEGAAPASVPAQRVEDIPSSVKDAARDVPMQQTLHRAVTLPLGADFSPSHLAGSSLPVRSARAFLFLGR